MKRQRQRRSLAQWQRIMGQFEASGQAASEFCLAHDLNLEYFLNRRRKLQRPSRFVAVHRRNDVAPITVQVADVTVRCSTQTSPEWLAELAARLRR